MDTQEHVSSEEEAATCAHSHAMAGSWAVSIYDLGEIDIQVTWHKVLTTPGATIEHGKRIAEAVLQAQRTAAPTPEYVSGWLAGREKSAATAEECMTPSGFVRPSEIAEDIRALAPPSAPPVQQIEDRMLLLKALLSGAADIRRDPDDTGLVVWIPTALGKSGRYYPMPSPAEPLDPDLTAALTKATHG